MASKGEEKIGRILRQHYSMVLSEFYYPDLVGKNGVHLRYDFAVFHNNKIVALVEYDGEAHFQQIKHFQKTTAKFRQAQERDRAKNKYALLHNIKLYRIPYWELSNIKTVDDIFQDRFLVKDKYHNDYLKTP